MKKDPISNAVACNLCTGCGACAGAFPDFIKMVDDPLNGRRPVVDASVDGQKAALAAVKLCAGTAVDYTALDRKDDIDATWGPVLATWEGYAADPEIRHRGSSGGAVTALALFALEYGAAGGVAHIRARAEDPRLNEAVISTTREKLMMGAGSRYAQASAAETIGAIAQSDVPVAFIGKPCDVASVHKADLGDKLAVTIAVFCAGAPNLKATDKLLERLQVPAKARLTALRYRGDGWPGLMQARYQTADGEVDSLGIPYGEGWGKILQAERRWRCRICTDHTGAFADVSVGDPWHNPPAGNTDAGRSLIIARSQKGMHLIEAAIKAGVLVATPAGRDVIAKAQPNLLASQGAVFARRWVMRVFGLTVPEEKGLRLLPLWLRLPAREKLQSVAGTAKRILRSRLWRPVVIQAAP